MRLVRSFLGVGLCVFVWVCACIVNLVTVALVLQPLFLRSSDTDYSTSSKPGEGGWNFLRHLFKSHSENQDLQTTLQKKRDESTGLGLFLFWIFEISIILAMTSHVLAVFTDPGSTKNAPHVSVAGSLQSRCLKCGDRWKPPRAHHCRICKECIQRMDHHCPWINNCVGLLNQKYFVLFLVYISIACLICLFVFFWGGVRWFCLTPSQKALTKEKYAEIGPTWLLVSALLVCVLIVTFFLAMTLDFLSEQWEALETNTTLIETYKNVRGRRMSLYHHMTEVFGKNFWFWWLPIPPSISPQWTEPVFREEESEISPRVLSEYRSPRVADQNLFSTILFRKRSDQRERYPSVIVPSKR